LINNIFGVDLDGIAVEIAKLSLLLKCMEGETEASIEMQLRLFNDKVLPSLDENIRCGNSLVQNSYLHGELSFDGIDFRKIKPLDWQRAFPEAFKKGRGGFDCVIGNPPYSAKQSVDNKYLSSFYKTVEYKCDLYAFFVERGMQLLKDQGFLGFITPVSWMTNLYFRKLREYLITSNSLLGINVIRGLVFDQTNIDTNILMLQKNGVENKKLKWITSNAGELNSEFVERDYNQFYEAEGYAISSEADPRWYNLKKKIDACSVELHTISKISLGMKLRSNDEFVVFKRTKKNPDAIVFGKDIAKYKPITPSRFFKFSKAVIIGGTKNPFIQQSKTKIFVQAIRNLSLKDRIVATLDTNGSYFIGTVNSVILNDDTYDYKFILGLLNSTLLNSYFTKRFTTISLTAAFLGVLPICVLSTESKKRKASEIIKFVDQIIHLNQELQTAALPNRIDLLQSRIAYNEDCINQLVYELYGLTKKEIMIIEGEGQVE
jgi:hypothetical protein